jgi:hypothetical protein
MFLEEIKQFSHNALKASLSTYSFIVQDRLSDMDYQTVLAGCHTYEIMLQTSPYHIHTYRVPQLTFEYK